MARYDDLSPYPEKWTNAKLMREARSHAHLETFSVGYNTIPAIYREGWHDQANKGQMPVEEFCREQTRIYRETWLNPILDEIECRFVKAAS